jgi:ATP-dependent DNA helicase HFM1/MER3
LDLTQPSKKEQPKKHIAPDSKAARMANLDFASSQATLPKATVGKTVGNRKRSNTRRRRSSSEYDDSSLDEFFSPTQPPLNNITGTDSPTVGTDLELADDFDQIIGSSNADPSNNIQSVFASTIPKTFGQRDTFSQVESKLSQLDKENSRTRASFDKILVSEPEGTLTKRKVERLSDAMNIGNASKRPKIDLQPSSDGDANTSHDPFNELQTHLMYQSESQDENIDALLLQEFGDIVNFSGI